MILNHNKISCIKLVHLLYLHTDVQATQIHDYVLLVFIMPSTRILLNWILINLLLCLYLCM